MGQEGIWGWNGAAWVKARVDAAGHLQVDVLTSALPAGGATAANQATIIGHIDGLEGLLGGGLPAALVAGSLSVINNAASEQHCYGYDGTNWQELLVESAAQKNLRVKLYDGATGIKTEAVESNLLTGLGLVVSAAIQARHTATGDQRLLFQAPDLDGTAPDSAALLAFSRLQGYNGATWDRLRTYGTGILKVGRAEIDSTTVRHTAAGAVVAGSHNLYWISCSPDAPGAEFELTDAIAGGGAVVFDHFDPDKHSEIINLDPPMKFATGIWIEKFDHIHSLVFCYV